MKRYPFIIGLIIAVSIISFMLKDFVRENLVIPSIQLVRLFNDLPQAFIWFVFIVFILITAYGSLNKWKPFRFNLPKKGKIRRRGHIEELALMVKRANKGDYAKYQLFQYLGELCVEIFAYKEKTTREDIRKRLEADTLDGPPDIIACLRVLFLDNMNNYGKSRDMRLSHRKHLESLGVEPSHIVRFLEQQLEVFNGTTD